MFTLEDRDELARHAAALDDQSAFIASLGSSRSPRMRDVLGTIQADQDAIIRAGSRGALVVDGGPGTGKTVVALHRSAYLLYSDPRLGHHRGGVLFVGPHQPYLAYVADVLPSLGEEGRADLHPARPGGRGGRRRVPSADPDVARLKSSAQMVTAIEPAVRFYEEPPTAGMTVETDWADVRLRAADWAEAFDAPDRGTPHNEAREQVWEQLVDDRGRPARRRRTAGPAAPVTGAERRAAHGAEPGVAAARGDRPGRRPVVGAGLPAPVRPVARTRRDPPAAAREPQAWTCPTCRCSMLLGSGSVTRRQHVVKRGTRRPSPPSGSAMATVVDDLIASDDSEMLVMSMLRGEDLQSVLVDQTALPTVDPDLLAGPFAHVVVDEAQELTDAEWQMLLLRCPSRSFTVVGDRAQARTGSPRPGSSGWSGSGSTGSTWPR